MLCFNLFSGRKQLLAWLFLLFSLNLFSQEYFNNLESNPVSGNWIGLQTIDSGFAHSGSYFSKTDSTMPYGLGLEDRFPDQMAGKNLYLKVSGSVKSNTVGNNALYVITLTDSTGNSIYWKGIFLKEVLSDTTNWHYFSESVKIPANQTRYSKIKAYLWNQNRNSETLIDDLRFEFLPIENPTFIPDLSVNEEIKEMEMIFGNQFYSIFSGEDGRIVINGRENKQLVNDIRYYTERRVGKDTISQYYDLSYKGSMTHKNKTILEFFARDIWGKLKIRLICDGQKGSIQFNVHEKYGRRQEVIRESIVVNYQVPVFEVYRQNRKVDNNIFKEEYWLENQGVLFKDTDNTMAIYHCTDISSLQLAKNNKSLFVNLDYELDHPFFRFPLAPDSTNWRLDESFSQYKNDRRQYSFDFMVNPVIETLPRFMKNPEGMEAAYIWTEHADFTDISTNRATYFGSEKIIDADSAVGGFVFYNIPVTKSVFYDNPDSVTNSIASNGKFNDLESTILTDDEYLEYLLQIKELGYDVCLHTPDHFTTTPELLEESLNFMKQNFGSPSWIDHGNNNGPENNREDLICDATLKNSPFYSLDLWKKYGVKYLHNAYYEELNTFGNWQFEPSLEKPYSGYGDFFPKPDYYQHKTLTNDIYHWSTSSAMFIGDGQMWNYMFNEDKLRSMIDNWYIEINHVYPAWVDPKKGMWIYNNDSIIVAHPGLNKALSNLTKFRDEGRLNITTIADHLKYRTAVDNISYSIQNDGRIKITNNNDFTIYGLSMAAKAQAVSVNGFIPKNRIVGDDIVFWFDINPGDSKIIRLIP